MRATPDPDGQSASVDLAFTNLNDFTVHLPLLQAASIMNEIRSVAAQLVKRQGMALDRGAAYLLEMCELARHPATYDVMIDPLTHDRIFLFQFDHDAPVTVRMSAEDLPLLLAMLARAIARAAN